MKIKMSLGVVMASILGVVFVTSIANHYNSPPDPLAESFDETTREAEAGLARIEAAAARQAANSIVTNLFI